MASVIGFAIMFGIKDTKISEYVSITNTLQATTNFWPIIIIGMILCGILIGVVSSSLATRRYLKL